MKIEPKAMMRRIVINSLFITIYGTFDEELDPRKSIEIEPKVKMGNLTDPAPQVLRRGGGAKDCGAGARKARGLGNGWREG